MQNFLFIVLQIFTVFIAFFLAYLVRRWRKEKIDLNTISELILFVGSPCLVFYKIATTRYELAELGVLSLAMIFFIAGSWFLTWIYALITRKKLSNIFYIATSFMNTANVGFPVTLFIFGGVAFQKAIILDLTMILLLFSVIGVLF